MRHERWSEHKLFNAFIYKYVYNVRFMRGRVNLFRDNLIQSNILYSSSIIGALNK